MKEESVKKVYLSVAISFVLAIIATILVDVSGIRLIRALPWIFAGLGFFLFFLIMGYELYRNSRNTLPVDKEEGELQVIVDPVVIDRIEFDNFITSSHIISEGVGATPTVGWLALQDVGGNIILSPTPVEKASMVPNFQREGTCYVQYWIFSFGERGHGERRVISTWSGTALFASRHPRILEEELIGRKG